VWQSLVPEPKRTLAAHLPAVLAHLLDGVVGREWRAREASCLAMAEILSGRTFDELGAHISELHDKLLRAVDDIKESVRKAALASWRALSSVLSRLVDGAHAPAEQASVVNYLVMASSDCL
jgi:proteasome component ECM29